VRSSAIGSAAVHGTILVSLFAVRSAPPLIVPGPDVVQVALIEPTRMPAVAPTPEPEPEPETKAPEVKPTEDTGVKITPPKPPKKKPEKKDESRPDTPAPPVAPALPYAPVGSAGLSGQLSVDAANFEFTYYLVLVRNRIAQNWTPPAGMVTRGDPLRAVVYFRIGRDGRVEGARVESGSAIDYFDRSALRAVMISDPLPPLPLGFSGSDLGVHFGFEFASP
jgi:protein TonB